MTCLLRKYCLVALTSSLRALETVRVDDFFASLCDMAWQTKARDQLQVSGPLLLAQGMQQVFWESRSYQEHRSAALSASRQYAKAPSARRFDRGSDIGLTYGQTESDLGSNVFITDAGLTEVFRNLQSGTAERDAKQRYLRRATLQLTTTALDGLPLLTEQI